MLDTLSEQIAAEQERLAKNSAAVEEARRDVESRSAADASRASDKGFQDSLKLYSSLPASQVKKIFMNLSEDTVMNYLQAMPPRAASKIVKEFKSKDELDLIHHVLEKMRQGSPTTREADGGKEPKNIGPGQPPGSPPLPAP